MELTLQFRKTTQKIFFVLPLPFSPRISFFFLWKTQFFFDSQKSQEKTTVNGEWENDRMCEPWKSVFKKKSKQELRFLFPSMAKQKQH